MTNWITSTFAQETSLPSVISNTYAAEYPKGNQLTIFILYNRSYINTAVATAARACVQQVPYLQKRNAQKVNIINYRYS